MTFKEAKTKLESYGFEDSLKVIEYRTTYYSKLRVVTKCFIYIEVVCSIYAFTWAEAFAKLDLRLAERKVREEFKDIEQEPEEAPGEEE